ncbi:hypothetical protein [Bacillus smithii]|uniref:hypothetical protein n=1 Tax=Bacillus smithii TaxID=1479 RepID=UPI003D24B6AE
MIKPLIRSYDFVIMNDEHYGAGDLRHLRPIALNKWFEDMLHRLDIPLEKLIIAFGNYGYDWIKNSKNSAESLTFSDIMKMDYDSHVNINSLTLTLLCQGFELFRKKKRARTKSPEDIKILIKHRRRADELLSFF